MAIKLTTYGISNGRPKRIVGLVTYHPISDITNRKNYFLVVRKGHETINHYTGYAAVLFEDKPAENLSIPFIYGYGDLSLLKENYIVVIDTGNGFTHILYRPNSSDNGLFVTNRCNSNCLMCSQPPRNDINDDGMVDELNRIIKLIPDNPEFLMISGGEPTLLKDGLISIVQNLKEKLPETDITMLSNGRMYAYEDFVNKLANVKHPCFLTSIPLHAHNAQDHDYIVQSKGAFDQTMQGMYNAAKYKLPVEIRIVLHKQTIPNLVHMVDFIYRNLPFVTGVMLMGMENMGYVKKNWDLLWIDPLEYAETLEETVKQFHYRRIHVALYNLPLCLIPKSLWVFAQQSISDFKNIYFEECSGCSVKNHCCGFFISSKNQNINIRAL